VAYFYLFWTQNVEHGWKAMSLGIITMTISSKKMLSKKVSDLFNFFHVSLMVLVSVSVSVSKILLYKKSIGIGFEKFWYRKKYRIRFRKILVSKKVSVSVSEKIWYRKKYWIRYQKNLVSEKSFGFGFVQILGFVTHCCIMSFVSCLVSVGFLPSLHFSLLLWSAESLTLTEQKVSCF
jgi:hypothetical protein